MEEEKLIVEEYGNIGPINGPDYDLFVDCTEMKLLS